MTENMLPLGHARVLIEITQPDGSLLSYDFFQIDLGDSSVDIKEVEPVDILNQYPLVVTPPEYEIDIEISGNLIPTSEYPSRLYEVKSHAGSKV